MVIADKGNFRWKKSFSWISYSSSLYWERTLEFRIGGTPRLLIIPFFVTLPNLIQHSAFINFGEFCQPPTPFIPEFPFINSCVQSIAVAWNLGKTTKLLYMLFLPHRTKLFSDYNEARRSVKRRIEQKNKWFFM